MLTFSGIMGFKLRAPLKPPSQFHWSQYGTDGIKAGPKSVHIIQRTLRFLVYRCTQKNIFEILLFRNLDIRKMVYTIWFRFDLIRFRKYFLCFAKKIEITQKITHRNFFCNHVKSNLNQIVFSIFILIWNQWISVWFLNQPVNAVRFRFYFARFWRVFSVCTIFRQFSSKRQDKLYRK